MELGTEGYTHAAEVWDLSIVQGPFVLCRPVPNPNRPIRTKQTHCYNDALTLAGEVVITLVDIGARPVDKPAGG